MTPPTHPWAQGFSVGCQKFGCNIQAALSVQPRPTQPIYISTSCVSSTPPHPPLKRDREGGRLFTSQGPNPTRALSQNGPATQRVSLVSLVFVKTCGFSQTLDSSCNFMTPPTHPWAQGFSVGCQKFGCNIQAALSVQPRPTQPIYISTSCASSTPPLTLSRRENRPLHF